MHSGHLLTKGAKMSKSLGNMVTVREFLDRHAADDLRLFCLQSRYRTK